MKNDSAGNNPLHKIVKVIEDMRARNREEEDELLEARSKFAGLAAEGIRKLFGKRERTEGTKSLFGRIEED